MSEDTTRAALAAAHKAWLDGGGDERVPESVARLLRGIFAGEWVVNRQSVMHPTVDRLPRGPQSVFVRFGDRGVDGVWASGHGQDCDDLLSALVALAAAGVPRRAEGAAWDRSRLPAPDAVSWCGPAPSAPAPVPGDGEGPDDPAPTLMDVRIAEVEAAIQMIRSPIVDEGDYGRHVGFLVDAARALVHAARPHAKAPAACPGCAALRARAEAADLKAEAYDAVVAALAEQGVALRGDALALAEAVRDIHRRDALVCREADALRARVAGLERDLSAERAVRDSALDREQREVAARELAEARVTELEATPAARLAARLAVALGRADRLADERRLAIGAQRETWAALSPGLRALGIAEGTDPPTMAARMVEVADVADEAVGTLDEMLGVVEPTETEAGGLADAAFRMTLDRLKKRLGVAAARAALQPGDVPEPAGGGERP